VWYLIKPEIRAIEEQHDLSIRYKAILLKGFHTIQLKGLTIAANHSEPLLHAASFNIQVKLKDLFTKKIEIKDVEANKLNIDFIKHNGSSNFDFIYRQYDNPFAEETSSFDIRNYTFQAERILKSVFKFLPPNASVKNMRVCYNSDNNELTLDIPKLTIDNNNFHAEIKSRENKVESEWVCSGTVQDKEQKLNIRLYTKDQSKKIALPFFEYKWGATILFDTLALELNGSIKHADIQTIQGKAGVKGLALYHDLLSPDTILLERGFVNYKVDIGKNFLLIDSAKTSVYLNKLKVNPYIRIEKNKDWHVRAALDKNDFPASDFFPSIPRGMFHNIEGLKAEGMLTYHFLLDVDMAKVDNLVFESTLHSNNFHILQYGNTDLRKMNGPFTLTIYEKETPVRTFTLGYDNPDFCSYRSISRYLPYAIMHAEDAGFMYHRGFIPDAFRRSLVEDIKERRFARGGSTLSMQLVKNVFLSRNKTIARKLEEIMIVWLIETCRLTSKERMFEVYMNVIEWGPNVYGVTEASRFYFAKEPSALTLGECVFLGYIISSPKTVRYHFNGTQIKPAFYAFYRDAVKRMRQRGWISPAEELSGNPNIYIKGPFMEKLFVR
jgi:hypothetical protein